MKQIKIPKLGGVEARTLPGKGSNSNNYSPTVGDTECSVYVQVGPVKCVFC